MTIDSKLDLTFERIIDVSPDLVWKAWTDPNQLPAWFCPLPWKTTQAEIELRPGGRFFTLMRSPEGQEFPNEGCYLEVVNNRLLTWTNALLSDFRPAKLDLVNDFAMTATILMEPHERGTHYRAVVQHADAESRAKHAAMNFEAGWGKALDQLIAHVKTWRT